jgi:ABC-type Fe3+-hydroxamate transport system substrate-binding protein
MSVRSVHDDLGAEVAVPERPRRLVSLVPNLSETLWWWGLVDRLVGVTDWCEMPPHAFDHATRVRGTKNPDVGAIVDLGPDLVVANEEENRELDVRRLREAGVEVYVTRVRTVADAAEALERLGDAVGARDPGRQLAATLRRGLASSGRSRPLLTACAVWRDPWIWVGSDTFSGSLLAAAGARVWHPPDDARYPSVALEDVRRAEPELVLLPDEPYPFAEADRAAFAGWATRVRRIDGAALTWWGPRTPTALADLARLVRTARRRPARGGVARGAGDGAQ